LGAGTDIVRVVFVKVAKKRGQRPFNMTVSAPNIKLFASEPPFFAPSFR
jgi:hypothetical protein